jgi:hypothetical protein
MAVWAMFITPQPFVMRLVVVVVVAVVSIPGRRPRYFVFAALHTN